MGELTIEIAGLKKSFKGKAALNGLGLRVPTGSIFAFMGRNGSGKSTTVKLLTNALKPDSGDARVFGLSVFDRKKSVDIRRRIGLVTEDKELYPSMSVGQVIRFTRPFFPKWRDDLERRYLRMFDLPPEARVPSLSKGTRSKLILLLALSHQAELLILDEPTAGLDPGAAEQVLRELVSLSTQGTTIFFSSHQIAEVEQIADHVAILESGRAAVTGALDDLKAQYQRIQVVFETSPPEAVRWMEGAERIDQNGRTVSILASHNAEAILEQARSLPGTALVERRAVTLKEIYLEHGGSE